MSPRPNNRFGINFWCYWQCWGIYSYCRHGLLPTHTLYSRDNVSGIFTDIIKPVSCEVRIRYFLLRIAARIRRKNSEPYKWSILCISLYFYSYWPDIDNALRKAAIERKIKIRLLMAKWDSTRGNAIQFLSSLQDLNSTYSGVDIEVVGLKYA